MQHDGSDPVEASSRRARLWLVIAAMSLIAAACGSSDTVATPAATDAPITTEEPTTTSTTTAVVPTPSTSAQVPTTLTPVVPTSTPAIPTSTNPVTPPPPPPVPLSVCTAADLPPNGNAFAPVMVSGIQIDDSDKGLHIRFDPTTASGSQFVLPNGATMTATGVCEISADGGVWWEVQNGQWSGWARSDYLTGYTQASSTCPAGNVNTITTSTVDSLLGDFDGDGVTDTLFLIYDGVVQSPAQWTGTTATVQIQFGDGGLSSVLDVVPLMGDGGPKVGPFSTPFGVPPIEHVDLAGTPITPATFRSEHSVTAAGVSHFAWASQCDPVILNVDFNGTAGHPLGPVFCDAGNGQVDLFALNLSLIHISEPTRPY